MGMVIHDMFLEHTSKFPDWRVVEIQQQIIEWEVQKASSLTDLEKSPFLEVWFEQLCKQSEAQRCV